MSLSPNRLEPSQPWFAAHELHTALQAIRGGVELLLTERGTGLAALQLEAVGLIAAAAEAIERKVLLLGEIDRLADETMAAPEKIRLATLLGDPTLAPFLSLGARLEAAGSRLFVEIVPPLAIRAIRQLITIAMASGSGPPLACEIEAVAAGSVALAWQVGLPASGENAIALRLATSLFETAGAVMQVDGPKAGFLILRLARPCTAGRD